jgi:hypothetical protein
MGPSQPVGVVALRLLLRLAALVLVSRFCCGQGDISSTAGKLNQRTFGEPASKVQAALDRLQPTLSGALPTLEGFVVTGQKSFDQYRRPYYHCTVRVTPTSSGGSLVRVTSKITAWHEIPPHSGYEILQSNGRLESDLLDRLRESLTPQSNTIAKSNPPPDISAPMPQLPKPSATISASATTKEDSQLRDARSLEEVLRNQSHPTNLLAVKQDQAPVLEAARADAKVLFLASAEDEFEILDVNPEWVHVRISGLSRGWLRRSTVEMLDGTQAVGTEPAPGTQKSTESFTPTAKAPFSISSEEVGVFPGDWAPLKGKSAKIISVQQAAGSGRITSPHDKLEFASSVLRNEVLSPEVDGLVLIFDAEDGGMVATTRGGLDQWKRGRISEATFWKQCFLDPPEILGITN